MNSPVIYRKHFISVIMKVQNAIQKSECETAFALGMRLILEMIPADLPEVGLRFMNELRFMNKFLRSKP